MAVVRQLGIVVDQTQSRCGRQLVKCYVNLIHTSEDVIIITIIISEDMKDIFA